MTQFEYRVMRPTETEAVSRLIRSGFDEYIAPDYTPEGVEEFCRYVSVESLTTRSAQDHVIVVASTAGTLAGMLELREDNHVALLFVEKAFHRRGVARGLLDHALTLARERDPDIERITVNSTRYGVPAYERLGFRQTGPERAVNGIVFIPMAKRLTAREAPPQTAT